MMMNHIITTVKEIRDFVCGNCNQAIHVCDGCDDYFRLNDEILCEYDEESCEYKHYHKGCNKPITTPINALEAKQATF